MIQLNSPSNYLTLVVAVAIAALVGYGIAVVVFKKKK